ncbi:hypothetical protein G5V58_13475 [Nocardioides anomalus]|uniref:Uncharacterized protein n=1 Tax=Nocardioides anomalus TaxID=2712223 RepID=A0A6G6WEQ0_9ACTN|nr:hypothetical protein [Nocardioides anomalus]QIG43633.1 hypothetical protein G5V58_13475 [Nocardioides anomalus]
MCAEPAFHTVLAAAIQTRGTTLAALRVRLAERGNPVSPATLSYWRSGRRRPEGAASLAAVEDLEQLLDLPRGHLTSRLGPSRRPGPPGRRADVHEVVADQAALVEQALSDLDLSGPLDLSDEALHIVVEVDAKRCVRHITIRGVWRSLREGAQRLPLLYVNDGPIVAMPEITVAGGRLGRDLSRPELGLVAIEFILDRPLPVGQETIAEQRTRFLDDLTDTHYEHYLRKKLADLTLWVRFDPEQLPTTVTSYTVIDDIETAEQLSLDGTTNASRFLRPFGPGRAGIRWTWD